MSLSTVCRVCLAMDVPMHIIADNPLQNTYEKLTGISLHTAPRPVVACYLCFCQLRKCHNLMVRSLKADKVLTQLLRSSEELNVKLLTMKIREIEELNKLTVTPIKLMVIGHNSVNKKNVKEEPLSPQCKEEIDTDRRRCIDHSTFKEMEDEENYCRVVQQDVGSIEDNGSIDREEINAEFKGAVDIERELIGSGDTVQEEPEEMQTNLQTCVDYMKFEDLEYEENFGIVNVMVNKNIEDEMSTDEQEIDYKESEDAVDGKDIKSAGAASTKKCKQTHAENRQDGGSTLAPDGNDFQEKPVTYRTVEEATSRNIGYLLRSSKKTNKRQVSTKKSKSESINKGVVCVVNDNVYTSTNRDVGNHLRSHTGDTPHECETCKVRFKYKYSLFRHLRIHTGEKPYECDICKVKFTEKNSLKGHLKVHTGEKPYECELCKVRFREKSNLKKHLSSHTGDTPHECEKCKVRFKHRNSLIRHLRIHTGETPYEDKITKLRSSQEGHLKTPLRIHTSKKSYECEICKVRFRYKADLKVHLRIHTGEKPYECEICKERFRSQGNMRNHLKVHTGEKPYECEICKFRFRQKSNLKIHLRIHTGETPYVCKICKVRFSQTSHLKSHLSIHTGEKPFECEICKARFRQKSYLKAHVIRIHTKDKSCE